ncbi:hypothetical protein D556_1497 [Bordetella holmesii 41130]|nr:hypothetical protein D560_1495 [Bordetella holmesii ATCC 51541]AIT26161.1 hypothetical protein D558_1487 [Bordetella holmesii 44057]EWM42643.1 hypothetical protein D556_1497 [Bordetella holmesii 41130]EWM46732.1 hypothetical protein D555_1511 [Bordetella holmesii 35009]
MFNNASVSRGDCLANDPKGMVYLGATGPYGYDCPGFCYGCGVMRGANAGVHTSFQRSLLA